MRKRPRRSMRGQFKVNSLNILLQPIRTIRNPVAVAIRQLDVHLSRSLPHISLQLDLPVKVPQKLCLPRQYLRTTRRSVTRQYLPRFQSQCLVQNIRPVRNVGVEQLVPRSIHRRIARTEHPLLRQPHISITRRMPPTQKKKTHLVSFVLQHKCIAVNNLLRSLDIDFTGLSNIVPLRHRRLPPRRLPAIHLGHHSAKSHRSRSSLGPNRIAIRMVAMGMRVEDITNRLLRQALGNSQQLLRSSRIVRIHDDQISIHLNNRRIAIPPAGITDQKPYTVADLLRSSILPTSPSDKTKHQQRAKQHSPVEATTNAANSACSKDTKTARMRGLCGRSG